MEKTPTQILEEMETEAERIEAVANDFQTGADVFAGISGFDLAALLGLDPENFECRTRYAHRVSLDDIGDPVLYYLDALEGKVRSDRVKKLADESAAFEAGERENDAELTVAERKLIETALCDKALDDGGCWDIAQESVLSREGVELEFEAEIGDGGDCFGCYGPYEIRDGKGAPTDDLYEGRSF